MHIAIDHEDTNNVIARALVQERERSLLCGGSCLRTQFLEDQRH